MNYSKAMLRALGQGVDRLNDGDPRDRRDADEVVQTLAREGYVYDHRGHFIHQVEILVTGHMHENGAWKDDLTDADRSQVVMEQGVLLPSMTQSILDGKFHDLPFILLESMAQSIRGIRVAKGLRFEPIDLVQ